LIAAEVAAVEPTVSVDEAPAAPLIVTKAGDIAQVIGSVALAGAVVTAQAKRTAPVNPLAGVVVRVALLPVVAPALTVIPPLLLSAIAGVAVTVTALVVEAVIFPVAASAPVTVTTYVPAVVLVVEFTVSVAVAGAVPVMSIDAGMLHVIGLVALVGEEVTTQLRFTTPAKLPVEEAVTVAVLPVVLPGLMSTAPALSEKLDCESVTVVVLVEPV
jgi:hypothetical protein